ncbi:MAG: alkaline phosphatase family protein [Cryomorphaceae bacterium]|nr:alkaline phosphatase family protein [Cryomorphaceae bacterium]
MSVLLFVSSCSSTTSETPPSDISERPKLVVGIVVDQMRYDYLYRYEDLYGDNGLKRLMREGFHFHNTNFPYVPTYTGPGHASIFTGTTPSIHGIIANNWFVKETKEKMYVTQDNKVEGVGAGGKEGKMSPANMLTTTFTDEWRLFTNFRSKTIGIALKDRGAILPAGHTANAAYWYDGGSGKWITSNYYMDTLPEWVENYNAKKQPGKYMQAPWETLLPLEDYASVATDDDVAFEMPFTGMSRSTFPYPLPVLYKKLGNSLIKNTPWGNTITFEMAEEAIRHEKLGQRGVTDMLTVSFSSPDYIGHQFGPRSVEIADQYLRFDKELGDFLDVLDRTLGEDGYVLFLTADHGAADAVGFSESVRIPAGLEKGELLDMVQSVLQSKYGRVDLIDDYRNLQFYLNDENIKSAKLQKEAVINTIVDVCRSFPGVLFAHSYDVYFNTEFSQGLKGKIDRGLMDGRSGDVIVALHPSYLEMTWQVKGTTHGTGYSYDTRVPWIMFGKNVPAGESFEAVEIIDIAPTISNMLRMGNPNGNLGISRLPIMLKHQ